MFFNRSADNLTLCLFSIEISSKILSGYKHNQSWILVRNKTYTIMKNVFKCMGPFLLLIILFFHSQVLSQNIKFEQISTDKGLSQSSVTSIIQDTTGFIWFGTYDGLDRYDGYNFKIFKTDNNSSGTISHNYVRVMCLDYSGRLWIGTMGGGLNLFNDKTETFVSFCNTPEDTNSISSNLISALICDSKGNLWIGTWGGGLNRLNLKEDINSNPVFKRYTYSDFGALSEDWNRISSLYEDRHGNIWIGSPYGLTKFNIDSNEIKIFRSRQNDITSISSNIISSMCEDKYGNLWVSTWDKGINRFNAETATFSQFLFANGGPAGPNYNRIMNLYKDKSGELWVGTWGNGLDKISLKNNDIKFIHYNSERYKNTGDFVFSIFEDKAGVLWVGSDWQGISKYDRGKLDFVHFEPEANKNSLNHSTVFPFLKDRYGNIWIGTRNGGINVFNRKNNSFRYYMHNPSDPYSLLHNGVRALYDDHKGSIWIGTGNGLDRYDYSTNKFIHYYINGLNPIVYIIYSICEDNKGNLWIGTYTRGVFKLNPDKELIENYIHNPDDPNSIGGNLIRCVFKDSKGLLWFASENNGISVYNSDTDRFSSYKNNPEDINSVSTNRIVTIFEDNEGNMWFGTGNGLNRLIKGKDGKTDIFKYYTMKDGLPSNTVHGILEDESGNLWISTTNGISKFNPSTEVFKNFNIDDGLQGKEFNPNSAFKDDATGEFYFGGVNGFNIFHPDSIHENLIIPNVVITDFKIANKSVSIGKIDDNSFKLEKSIIHTNEISLSYKENVFTIEFAALHFNSPTANHYQYKLENFNDSWIAANYNQRSVTYTNLNPGHYIFHVKASNNDGIWNETGKSLQINIIPPFWQTLWFRIMMVAIIIYIISFTYRIRTKTIQNRNRFLKNEVALRKKAEKKVLEQNERLEEAVKAKTEEMKGLMEKMIRQEKLATIGEISGSIAHELRNPLGAVRQSVYFLKMKYSDVSDKLANHLALIDNELSIADNVINDLLEMTRFKSIKKEYTDLKFLFSQSVKRCALDDIIKIEYKLSPEDQFGWVDQTQMGQVFVNLIINAAQAIDKKGTIRFKISKTADLKFLQIDIEDTGKGIEDKHLSKIFEPLYTTKAKGTGLGLSICRQIVEKHDGIIKVSSNVEKGTRVSVFIPNLRQ